MVEPRTFLECEQSVALIVSNEHHDVSVVLLLLVEVGLLGLEVVLYEANKFPVHAVDNLLRFIESHVEKVNFGAAIVESVVGTKRIVNNEGRIVRLHREV